MEKKPLFWVHLIWDVAAYSTGAHADIATHAAITNAHHTKTTSFTDLTDTATTAKIADNAVTEPKLKVFNSPTDGQVLSWDNSASRLMWADSGGGITIETDPQVGSNTTDYISRWNGSALVTSSIYDNGNGVSIGTPLDIGGHLHMGY